MMRDACQKRKYLWFHCCLISVTRSLGNRNKKSYMQKTRPRPASTPHLIGDESVLAIQQIEERSVDAFSIVLGMGVKYLHPEIVKKKFSKHLKNCPRPSLRNRPLSRVNELYLVGSSSMRSSIMVRMYCKVASLEMYPRRLRKVRAHWDACSVHMIFRWSGFALSNLVMNS